MYVNEVENAARLEALRMLTVLFNFSSLTLDAQA